MANSRITNQQAEKIRLVIPRTGNEEFRKITGELSRNGAIFDPEKKAWFINPDQADRFKDYLPGQIQLYKGYAYKANSIDPQIIKGETPDDIIIQVRKWNDIIGREHPDGKQYKYCNIGKLEGEKYKNYVRYDISTGQAVTTGKDISRVYLEFPHVGKQDFEAIREYLKGLKPKAQFDWDKKQWYVRSDQADQVNDYLRKFQPSNTKGTRSAESAWKIETATGEKEIIDKKELEEIAKQVARPISKIPGLYSVLEGIEVQYAVKLKDGSTVRISQEEIEAKTGIKTSPALSTPEIVDAIELAVAEKVKIIDTPEYVATIHPDANKCNISFPGKEKVAEILGDQYYVDFRRLADEEVKEIISRYIEQLQKKPQENVQEIGKTATLSIPYSGYSNNGFSYITGVEEVKGILTDIQHMAGQDIYQIRELTGGEIRQISSKEIYSDQQTQVLLRAAERKLLPEEFDMVAQKELSAAQMDQVLSGFADGLTTYQVCYYANPAVPVPAMDNYRYGLQHGIGYYDLKQVIDHDPGKWEDCRREIDKIIRDNRQKLTKDIELKGYHATPEIVKKIEQLNGITGRQHTIKDICEAYKAGARDTLAGRLIKDISKEFKLQQQNMNISLSAPVQ